MNKRAEIIIPKSQSAVPFTPVTGRRICVKAGYETLAVPALIEGRHKTSPVIMGFPRFT